MYKSRDVLNINRFFLFWEFLTFENIFTFENMHPSRDVLKRPTARTWIDFSFLRIVDFWEYSDFWEYVPVTIDVIKQPTDVKVPSVGRSQYIYICLYIHIYIYTHIHIYMYMFENLFTFENMYQLRSTESNVQLTWKCPLLAHHSIYVYIYIYIYIYIYAYVYIYILFLNCFENLLTFENIYQSRSTGSSGQLTWKCPTARTCRGKERCSLSIVLQCVAVCCSNWQCVAVSCCLQERGVNSRKSAVCNTLHHTATHCNTLQHAVQRFSQ